MTKLGTFFFAILPICLLLSGCNAPRASDQSAAARSLAPEHWSQEAVAAQLDDRWIESLGDAALPALIAEAHRNNFGIEAARQQTRAAEAAARIAGAGRGPQFGLALRSSRQRSVLNLPQPLPVEIENHSLTVATQWELDLWNRLAQIHSAAAAQYEASVFELAALQLSLSGQVAKSWFNAIEARRQSELAEASALNLDTRLSAIERRYQRGLSESLDLRLARAQAHSSRASAANRRIQADVAVRQLETLLGRYPDARLSSASDLPSAVDTVPAGLPSDLLRRRPDLRAQERRVAAAAAQSTAAQRNWLPSFALTASGGNVSEDFSRIFNTDFNVWSLAGELAQPLFQGGRLKAERDQAVAMLASQLAQYKDLALQAFREVESALRSEVELVTLQEQSLSAAEESERSAEQAWRLYERGLIDISAALDAERRSFDAESQLISVRNQRLQSRIELFMALGGGFDPEQASTSTNIEHANAQP